MPQLLHHGTMTLSIQATTKATQLRNEKINKSDTKKLI